MSTVPAWQTRQLHSYMDGLGLRARDPSSGQRLQADRGRYLARRWSSFGAYTPMPKQYGAVCDTCWMVDMEIVGVDHPDHDEFCPTGGGRVAFVRPE